LANDWHIKTSVFFVFIIAASGSDITTNLGIASKITHQRNKSQSTMSVFRQKIDEGLLS